MTWATPSASRLAATADRRMSAARPMCEYTSSSVVSLSVVSPAAVATGLPDSVPGRPRLPGGNAVGQSGGGGHGIARQRSRLVDGAGRGQLGHDIGTSAEGRGGESAAHDLAEGEQVRCSLRVAEPIGLIAVPAGC